MEMRLPQIVIIFLLSSAVSRHLTCSFRDSTKFYYQLLEVELVFPVIPDSLVIWIFTFSDIGKYEQMSISIKRLHDGFPRQSHCIHAYCHQHTLHQHTVYS